jgi:UDP-N-acetyl-2-amino-2-deoxyglucuronate dehydrogenase
MADFALIGAAGYIAPRHMQAISATGNRLVAALDRNDSVGIIDRYFPEAAFFTEAERFDRHLEKLRRNGQPAHYLSVCTPNYLHDAHIRFGLRQQMNVICEKPVVLQPDNLLLLQQLEQESGKKVSTVFQLRLHPAIQALRAQVAAAPPGKTFDIDLTYITARGKWYYASWKGDKQKSGGIATNIGIHFFDLLCWIFGPIA